MSERVDVTGERNRLARGSAGGSEMLDVYLRGIAKRDTTAVCPPLRRAALVRKVPTTYEMALKDYAQYYESDVGLPNQRRAVATHSQFVSILIKMGVRTTVLEALDAFPDSCFIEDTAIALKDIVLIPNMGHESRLGEAAHTACYLRLFKKLVKMPKYCRVDGGDVVRISENAIFVGCSDRTNAKGVDFLKTVGGQLGMSVLAFDVPDDALHLSSIMSAPASDVVVIPESTFSAHQAKQLMSGCSKVVRVPRSERYAANVIGFPSSCVLVPAGHVGARAALEERNFSVIEIDMRPFQEADGSLSCLCVFYE